jgi:hypothetical protein
MLRRTGLAALVLLSVPLTGGQPALAQKSEEAEATQNRPRPRQVQANVINRTQTTLQIFHLAQISQTEWGADRLGSEVLDAGARFRVTLPAGQCRYDFRGIYEDGREVTRFNLDLCRSPDIILTPTDTEASLPPPRGRAGLYRVVNRTGQVVQTMQVAPSASAAEQTEDILGASILPNGNTFTGRFAVQDPCLFTVTATLQNGTDPLVVTDHNFCTTRELVLTEAAASGTAGEQRPGQESRVLTVVNRGRTTIQVINVRPAGGRNWGADRLGSDVLPPGRRLGVRLPQAPCNYDVRVTYDGGGEETRSGHDVCANREISFAGNNATARRGREKGPVTNNEQDPAQVSEVTVVNRSQIVIEQVNISSSRVSEWGEDHLGAGVIEPGNRFTVRIQRDGQCDFDVRVQYRGGREERRMRQNICEGAEVVFAGPNSRLVDGGGPANGRLLRIMNEGPVEVMELYLSASSNTHWGEDRLGQSTLPRRFRYEVRVEDEGCQYDIRVVYRGGAAEERRGQDMCAQPELRLSRRHAAGTLVSTGTGFYVTDAGHVLTNQHVVDGCSIVGIYRPNGERVRLRLIASDEDNDLALLQQEGAQTAATPFRPADVPVRAGDRVVIVGWPARQELGHVNVTEGLVAGLRGARGDERQFQYTAPTQAGNSGGPIFDEAGRVIGVVVAQLTGVGGDRQAQNVNFGIRQDIVRKFLEANGVNPSDDTAGTPVRPADILDRSLPSVLPLDCLG